MNEIQTQTVPVKSGSNACFVIRNESGLAWKPSTTSFTAWIDANIDTYKLPMVEQGTGSGYYVGSWPDEITSTGNYSVVVYDQAGNTLTENDEILATGSYALEGDGGQQIDPASPIQIQLSGQHTNVFAVIRNPHAQVWQPSSSTFVDWNDANVNDYAVPMSEQGTASGYFVADWPAAIKDAGKYNIVFYDSNGIVGQTVYTLAVATYSPTGGFLVSPAYLRSFLGLTTTDNDTLLSYLIRAASAAIQGYCRRDFISQKYTEDVDGPGDYVLQLRNVPVVNLESVTLNPYTTWSEQIDGSNYIIDKARGQIRLKAAANASSYFGEGWKNVQVQYQAGYFVVPPDIQQVCVELARGMWMKRGSEANVTMEKIGDYQVNYSSSVQRIAEDQSIRMMLDRYKDFT